MTNIKWGQIAIVSNIRENCDLIPLISLVLILQVASFSAWSDCDEDSDVQTFFDRLSGAWQGEAVTTPVGPLPYDISFKRREPFWIYGQAMPGAAVHHWGFYCEHGELWLRFLTTFRGNRDPILLQAISITDTQTLFKAKTPAFLQVKIRPGQTHSSFEVMHHGERHVLIELKRATE
jgi:hypothetical protein